ncbi:MAG: GAG-pre-integrase domain-containing protein [Pirellula sp.]|nr:GAG-pre-integrase domain-containing protein [Pirellula sp.]
MKIKYHPTNNLPIFYAHHKTRDTGSDTSPELNSFCVTSETNRNLKPSEKELLKWHFRLGHLNFASIQQVLKGGWLGNDPTTKAASRCEHPKCASCEYGKAKRRPTGSSVTRPTNSSSIKTDDLRPGQRVSMDH